MASRAADDRSIPHNPLLTRHLPAHPVARVHDVIVACDVTSGWMKYSAHAALVRRISIHAREKLRTSATLIASETCLPALTPNLDQPHTIHLRIVKPQLSGLKFILCPNACMQYIFARIETGQSWLPAIAGTVYLEVCRSVICHNHISS